MTKRNRDLRQLLQYVATQANARLFEIRHTNGGHLCALFDRGKPVFISSTPSDRCFADRKVIADVRRQLRAC